MLIYWLLLAIPAAGSFLFARQPGHPEQPNSIIFLWFFIAFYCLMAGLRHETGGDWATYWFMTHYIRNADLGQAMAFTDAGFGLVSYVSLRLGTDLYGINFFCAAALVIGCARLAWRTPSPWIALMSAVPYILIVIGMGYLRQAAAMGFILLSLVNLIERNWVRGLIYFVCALLLHISAIVVVPVVALVAARRNPFLFLPIALFGAFAFFFLLSGKRMDQFEAGYIKQNYESAGALVRLLMNFVPAVLFLMNRRRVLVPPDEKLLWTLVSWISIGFVVFFPLISATTALDRTGLFFAPLQIFVFGYFLQIMQAQGRASSIYILGLILYLIFVQLIWLFFAEHSYLWVPYKSVIFA
ncbi:MAG: EpsG family protein [Tsuneonella sp.]